MEADERRLRGLECARSWNFTDAQYEEALKRIDSPDNANQLLVALIDVSSRSDTCCNGNPLGARDDCTSGGGGCNSNSNGNGNKCQATSTLNSIPDSRSSSSSCYSSITSFPSSLDQSLEGSASGLRDVYIDGSNVARTHGKDASFSWLGIKLCADWFLSRQHKVKVFVPVDRCVRLAADEERILRDLIGRDALVRTPSGCNDDMFVIEAAKQNNAIIVSNDQYRDETRFNSELKSFTHLNRLPYVFVDDSFFAAGDPRGRSGPTLDEFLRCQDTNATSNGHNKLSRARSHNSRPHRYNAVYVKSPASRQFTGPSSRALHYTQSLPTEPTQRGLSLNINQDFDQRQPAETVVTRCYQYGDSFEFNASRYQARQQVRQVASVVSPSRDGEHQRQQQQPAGHNRKQALCKAKSHNI